MGLHLLASLVCLPLTASGSHSHRTQGQEGIESDSIENART